MPRVAPLLAIVSILLTACAPRGVIEFTPAGYEGTDVVPVLLGTTRAAFDGVEPGPERGDGLSFLQYDVSIPPDHEGAGIKWPGRGGADPRTDFLTTDIKRFQSGEAYVAALRRELAKRPPGQREVSIFVHGYNTNFAEAAYRAAQLTHDFGNEVVTTHFNWPSQAKFDGYLRDRDSALISRDAFEQFIRLTSRAGADRLIIIAHSMGGFLTMETLRQMELAEPGVARRMIYGVALVSPDIDLDLFRAQVRDIQALPEPFVVVSSEGDRALRLSQRLANGKPRLGQVQDLQTVEDLPILLVNIKGIRDASSLQHWTLGNSALLTEFVRSAPDVDELLRYEGTLRAGSINANVQQISQATGVVLQP